MNRLDYNKDILRKIELVINDYPKAQFTSILSEMEAIIPGRDLFYEEPEDTLERMNRSNIADISETSITETKHINSDILTIISNVLFKYPDFRFNQILYGLGITDNHKIGSPSEKTLEAVKKSPVYQSIFK